MTASEEWLKGLPKIQLHHHLDGAVRAETLWELQQRLGGGNFATFEELSSALCARGAASLAEFLSRFELALGLFRRAHAEMPRSGWLSFLERVGRETTEDLRSQGCVYAETRFCPQLLFMAKPSDEDLFDATMSIVRGIQEFVSRWSAEKGSTFVVGVILCSLWDHPEWTGEVVDIALRARTSFSRPGAPTDVRIVGVDIAGNEHVVQAGDPAHSAAFQRAESLGIPRTVHAGEASSSIAHAVNDLRANRIGHGYHACNDLAVQELLKSKGIHLECTITPAIIGPGNYHLSKQRAIAEFARRGVSYSLSTDDPVLKCIVLVDEYLLAYKVISPAFSGDQASVCRHFVAMQHRSLESAFCSEETRKFVKQSLAPIP